MISMAPDRPELLAALKAAIEAFEKLSPEEQRALRREQRISFVYGNCSLDNDRITREMVEQAVDRM